VRFSITALDKSNENNDWHIFAVSVLEVLNIFMESYLLWPPCGIGQAITFLLCVISIFFLFLSFFLA